MTDHACVTAERRIGRGEQCLMEKVSKFLHLTQRSMAYDQFGEVTKQMIRHAVSCGKV